MKNAIFLCSFFFLLFVVSAHPDTVTLKDGERVTGTWVSVSGGNLIFKSDALGDLTIPLSKVRSFSSSQPAVVIRKDHSVAKGNLEMLPSGDWRVIAAGKTEVVPAGTVETIVTQANYTALVEHHATLWHDWHGAANAGYNLQRGDQQTGTLSANVAATRERPAPPIFVRHLRTNYSLLMLFSKAQQGSALIRSNTMTTLLREDYLFAPDTFIFGFGQLDHIQAQGLYLRQTYGGGFGRDVIHSSRTLFSLLGGITFVNEKLYTGGPARQSAEALLGEKLGITLGPRVRFDHFLNFYPDLTHTGEYHFDTTSGLTFKLTSRLLANISLVDNYLSDPAPGNHKNNVALTTGVGVTF